MVLHHSHLDVGYTHSQPMMWEIQSEFITETIDWLEETADLPDGIRPKWTCEASETVERWVAASCRSQRQRFQALVEEGRIGLGGLRWNAAALVDERAARRLLEGKDRLEQLTGSAIRVACQHDVNGIPWPMADALLDSGIELLVMAINIHLGGAVTPRPGMFLWEAPSGRSLRVFNGPKYASFDQWGAWDDSVEAIAAGWADLSVQLDKSGYPYDFLYLTSTCAPVMWDNNPPNPFLPDLLRRWNAEDLGPPVRYATFEDLRARAAEVPDNSLVTQRGDWTDYWSFGYGSSPIATATNEQAKPLLAAAEVITRGAEHPILQQARDKIDLYDEHTFGYFDTDPAHPQMHTMDLLKQAVAHEGHEMAAFAIMDGLERLAGNPVADKGITGVLACNPTPYPVTVSPVLPAAWFTPDDPQTERTFRSVRMLYRGRPWGLDFPGADARAFGEITLEPYSWRTIPFDELPAAPDTRGVSHVLQEHTFARRELDVAHETTRTRYAAQIESPFHVLRYDARTGRVLSLVDKDRNRELLADDTGMDFFSFVRERPDALVDETRDAYYEGDLDNQKYDRSGWKPWATVRERATRVTRCAVVETPGRVTLERALDAPGTRHLVQRFTLVENDPIIHIEVELDLVPDSSPQGIYFALPLAMKSGWQAMFDTAGAAIRLDDDQLPGSCRNWVTAQSMVAMWDDEGAVGLLTPDAPMVQFGDFHFGPPVEQVPRPENPLLLAWPYNNYWSTNFPLVQAGRIRLRYGVVSMPELDVDSLRRHSAAMRLGPLFWPRTTDGRAAGSGFFRDAPQQ